MLRGMCATTLPGAKLRRFLQICAAWACDCGKVDALAGRVLIATIKASLCEVGAFVGKVLTVAIAA